MTEHDLANISVGQFETVGQLLASSVSMQIAFAIMIVGLIIIFTGYRKFSHWIRAQKFSYRRTNVAKFARVALLPLLSIALITSTNLYIQTSELFANEIIATSSDELTAEETFAKILNSLNIIVIGWTISHLIPIILNKRENSKLELEDYNTWYDARGFPDDQDDFFHKCFKWNPPENAPMGMSDTEFKSHLKTQKGKDFLENFRTSKGLSIGNYEKLIDNPYEEWKKSERAKYEKYYDNCVTGNNQSGQKLKPGAVPDEIYRIDTWREQKRLGAFESIIPSARPPGYAKKKREGVPKSAQQILPVGIFLATVLGVVSWWGIDLIVLATATGGIAFGVGLALRETMENYFAYIMIRKDKIVNVGDRVKLPSGYNGSVFKITPRVTYVKHGLNESVAIIPTKQLVTAEIINYTKEFKLVPATVEVGVSYLNDPKQVEAILVKVGIRAMKEVTDDKGKHIARQIRCPYLDENKASCGCDKDILVDVSGPIVRFNHFNDSALDFALLVYVRDYGSQFKMKSEMRVIMYEEFKKYDIRIPWPIRTVYQGDEKKEGQEISKFDDERNEVVDKYGQGIDRPGQAVDDE